MLDNIENNALLITPNGIKNKLLKKQNQLINIKIMTLEEFIKGITFEYDNETLYYLMNEYNLKYEVALVYLRNIYYIENKKYNKNKLNKLVEIKNYLENNNLLIKDELFKQSLKTKKIYIYGYDYINSKDKKILEELNVTYLKEEKKLYDNQLLYEFNTKEEEIEFVATKIIDLVDNNVPLNKIKIIKPNEEYQKEIEKIFKIYNINIDKRINLYSTNIIKLFLKNISFNVEENLEIIKKNINLENELNLKIYNKLISILNNYSFIKNYEKIKEMLIYNFKNTYINKEKYQNKIEFINLKNNIIENDNYVFLVGFNIGNIPNIKKDEDYISDNLKEELNLDTTNTINKLERKILIQKIKTTNNLIITYRIREDKEYYLSSLNDDLNLEIIKNYKIPYYSNLNNQIKLTKKLDILNKYNSKETDLDILYNNYQNINYKTYDNKFTSINNELFKKYIDNKLLLSYSSMNNYFKCGFKYYIENVLKLNPYEETFTTLIGSLFHHVLEKAFRDNFDLDKTYDEYLKKLNKEFNKKEIVFLTKLKEELKFIIETIKKQYENTTLDKTLYEEKIYVTKNTNITFLGIIDKLMYKEENDKTYVAIIDYKTGNPLLNLNNMIYGIDMQLPIYLYLSKRTNKLKNVEVIGFYLQKILNNEITIDHKNTYLKQKENNLKLQGYSISDMETLEKFDKTYADSEVIKSMKVSKNGFYSYAKVLDKKTLDLIDKLVDDKIDEAANNIMNANFIINPKQIGDTNVSCKFCKYKDICYKQESDTEYLKEYKDLEFLK